MISLSVGSVRFYSPLPSWLLTMPLRYSNTVIPVNNRNWINECGSSWRDSSYSLVPYDRYASCRCKVKLQLSIVYIRLWVVLYRVGAKLNDTTHFCL